MNVRDFAALLEGREYGSEIAKDECEQAKKLGFLVLFGYSDDNVELRGSIDDEISAWDGTTISITSEGVLYDWESIRDGIEEHEAEEYFARRNLPRVIVEAVWDEPGQPVWQMKVDPECIESRHFAHFTINEDGEPHCRGVVIDLAGLNPAK